VIGDGHGVETLPRGPVDELFTAEIDVVLRIVAGMGMEINLQLHGQGGPNLAELEE
jgi:hypothetical protein